MKDLSKEQAILCFDKNELLLIHIALYNRTMYCYNNNWKSSEEEARQMFNKIGKVLENLLNNDKTN